MNSDIDNDIDKSLKVIQANIRRKIFTKIRSFSSISPSISRSSRSRISVFIADLFAEDEKLKTVNKISRFLQSKLIVDKYTLNN